MSNLVTCKCKWVYFSVSKQFIKDWQTKWNEYWPTLDKEGRESFGLLDGPPTPKEYFNCGICGTSYTDMYPSKPGDCPDGCTISPIMNKDEVWD
jgi:hypothetical protein